MAFVYNTEKVRFRQIAGEIVLPQGQLIVSPRRTEEMGAAGARGLEDGEMETRAVEAALSRGSPRSTSSSRTPFVVAFESSWFKFNLCTVHIYYGEDSGDGLQRRIDEIRKLVEFIADRQDKENELAENDPGKAENYILLGDFNVVSPEHETMKALESQGFEVPEAIDGDKIRTPEDHFYDQIAVRVAEPHFRVATGGLVDMYASVFQDAAADRATYGPFMPASDDDDDSDSSDALSALSPLAHLADVRPPPPLDRNRDRLCRPLWGRLPGPDQAKRGPPRGRHGGRWLRWDRVPGRLYYDP